MLEEPPSNQGSSANVTKRRLSLRKIGDRDLMHKERAKAAEASPAALAEDFGAA
jgi:hypothetical protein